MAADPVEEAPGAGAVAPEPATCSSCGVGVADRPATWSLSVGPRGAQWLCERCTRDHLRSIEGKLDEAWW